MEHAQDQICLRQVFEYLSELCNASDKLLVLMIDDVDHASNNQVFLDFLGMFRDYSLRRDEVTTFQSVILAGVYDIKNLKQFCFTNGYMISGIFFDIASGISFENRKEFFLLLDEIIDNKVERVVITYKDRLSKVEFDLFSYLFKKYHCEIVVMSKLGSKKLDRQEIFEEIVSLLHGYSMNLYNKRKIPKIKELIEEDESAKSGKTCNKTES